MEIVIQRCHESRALPAGFARRNAPNDRVGIVGTRASSIGGGILVSARADLRHARGKAIARDKDAAEKREDRNFPWRPADLRGNTIIPRVIARQERPRFDTTDPSRSERFRLAFSTHSCRRASAADRWSEPGESLSRAGSTMFRFLLLPFLFQLCCGFTGNGEYYPGRADLFELSVIHLNDFHARFEQTGAKSGACHEGEEKDCVGGIARVFTEVNRLKKERPNAIFLNAGDHFQGTLWYNVHRWNVTATFMNMLPHDAMTIGNHEFDNNVEGVVPFLKMIRSPVVVANMDASEEPTIQGLYENSTIIEVNGRKIGVIGIILSTTNTISSTGKLKFLDEVDTVNEEARRLKSRGVDIIFVLSHSGLDVDRRMAAKCPLIDVIVGGHSHTFLYTGQPPFIDVPEDDYPVTVVQENTNRTVLIVQAAAYTKYLGNLTVWFDERGEVVDWDGNPILLDYSVEQDPGVLRALEPWKVVVDEKAKSKIAASKVFLDNQCRKKECNLGNLITDAMVDSYVDKAENKTFWTYAAVAVMNPGGIRAPIDSMGEDVTYADLMMVQPFENTWDTVELKGSCILQILEMKGMLVWSGLRVIYNVKNDSRTVVDVKIRCRACEVPRFENLDEDQWYRIVVPTFLVHAGDGYDPFETCGRNHRVGYLDSEELSRYMRKISPITTGLDRRVIITNH